MKNLTWGSGQGKGKEGQSKELGARGLWLGGHGTVVRCYNTPSSVQRGPLQEGG